MKPSVALTTALSGAYLARAIVVMIIVGSVLNLINQGEALFQLRQTPTHLCGTVLRIDLRNVVRPDYGTLTAFNSRAHGDVGLWHLSAVRGTASSRQLLEVEMGNRPAACDS